MLHLLDSLTGLVLVYATSSLPFCVWMLKGYFDTLPLFFALQKHVVGGLTAGGVKG